MAVRVQLPSRVQRKHIERFLGDRFHADASVSILTTAEAVRQRSRPGY